MAVENNTYLTFADVLAYCLHTNLSLTWKPPISKNYNIVFYRKLFEVSTDNEIVNCK